MGESLKLILIRHGETVENASGILQGQMHGILSEKGRRNIMAVARRFEGERFDRVYSSDLERAVKTAEILMDGRRLPAVLKEPRLREQCFGVYEGKRVFSLLKQICREGDSLDSFKPDGGECPVDFRARVGRFLEEIKGKHFGETVVLVTHYGVIMVIMGLLSAEMPQNRIKESAAIILGIDRTGGAKIEIVNYPLPG